MRRGLSENCVSRAFVSASFLSTDCLPIHLSVILSWHLLSCNHSSCPVPLRRRSYHLIVCRRLNVRAMWSRVSVCFSVPTPNAVQSVLGCKILCNHSASPFSSLQHIPNDSLLNQQARCLKREIRYWFNPLIIAPGKRHLYAWSQTVPSC